MGLPLKRQWLSTGIALRTYGKDCLPCLLGN